MGILDWGGGGVQDTLKRLDQLDPERPVLSNPEYDAISEDFFNDVQSAIGMTMAFYDAIVNQSASFRNYQTEFDPYYGDVLRLGIIIDKLFATMAFMDLQDVWNYNPNIRTYVAMYDAPFGDRNGAISQRFCTIRNHHIRVKKHIGAQAITGRAGTERAIERKQARLNFL